MRLEEDYALRQRQFTRRENLSADVLQLINHVSPDRRGVILSISAIAVIGFALDDSMPGFVSLFSKAASDIPQVPIVSTAVIAAVHLISVYYLPVPRGEMTR